MKTEKRLFGDLGEDAAAKYLLKNKFKVIERNYTSGKNEIDIIAENRDFLIFVEVKTRTYDEQNLSRFGRACEAVDVRKQRCLIAAARAYCATHKLNKRVRMDVIEVYFDATTSLLHSINHMPDAFRIE